MDRRKALADINKATITTGTGGLLAPEQSKAFIQTIKDRSGFGKAIRLERRRAASGELNKLTSGSRLLRGAPENSDDGYRAGVTFPSVEYATAKMRLPWEVTEDEFHENIEEQALEAKITDEMTQQFALDWDDLDINGDEANEGAEKDFLSINDGLLVLSAASEATHKVDAEKLKDSEGNELKGAMDKAVFFQMLKEMPSKYINTGRLRWFMSPHRWITWVEYLTERKTAAGDSALSNKALNPLGIPPFVGATSEVGEALPGVPAFPDDRIILADPTNFLRVVSWDVRKLGPITGQTDMEMATRDKRGYIYFVKSDFIILEDDGVVDTSKLAEI